jgi:cytochrome c oxidase subunit 4
MADHHDDLPKFNHPAPTTLLFGVFIALIGLTILTVVTSAFWPYSELPKDLAFPVAMVIASAKAFLVCAFFMHMWWDKGFNIVIFLSSGFFVALFVGLTLLDTSHYQDNINNFPRNEAPQPLDP